jgi:hypothetical protein
VLIYDTVGAKFSVKLRSRGECWVDLNPEPVKPSSSLPQQIQWPPRSGGPLSHRAISTIVITRTEVHRW